MLQYFSSSVDFFFVYMVVSNSFWWFFFFFLAVKRRPKLKSKYEDRVEKAIEYAKTVES